MNTSHYDLLVIGAGAAGSTAATTAANEGAQVAMVERDQLGGTCLNYGCDPTKTLLTIASMLHQTKSAARYGLQIPAASANWGGVQAYVREVMRRIRGGTSEEAIAELQKQHLTVLQGEATFLTPHRIAVNDRYFSAERIIIATGSQTIIPSIPGLDTTGFITNVEAVSLPELPKRLAILGGGPIGLEFAQLFQRFGVEVWVLEHNQHMLDKEDRALAEQLCELLTAEGIHLATEVEVQQVASTSTGKSLHIQHADGKEEDLLVDEILLAIGRLPAIEGLNLEAAGVRTTSKGISVDATLLTSVPHIWAAGDVTSSYQFTHVAYQQGKVAATNAFADHPQTFDHYTIPWITYTDPPLAHVGKTEEELRAAAIPYKVGQIAFSEVERAISNGQTTGQVKLLVDLEGQILGGHILGQRADDLLAPIIIAMRANLPVNMLANTILPYPTLSEAVRWVAERLQTP